MTKITQYLKKSDVAGCFITGCRICHSLEFGILKCDQELIVFCPSCREVRGILHYQKDLQNFYDFGTKGAIPINDPRANIRDY